MSFFKKQSPVVMTLNYSKPFIFLNFKTYKESSGANAIKLARIAERVQQKTGVNIILCPQISDIKDLAQEFKIPIYAQHVDVADPGKNTGGIVPANLMDINVHGSILNHSEHPLDIKTIEAAVIKLKELDMKSIVCAKDDQVAKKLGSFKTIKPDFIAVEPPELIGTETSVSDAKPEIIKKAVDACNGVNLIVGAGIKSNQDLRIALQHGAKGVLLASHFVLSTDPEKFLMDLVKDI